MISTIREQLSQFGVETNQSVYADYQDGILDFPISTAPFLNVQLNEYGQAAVFQKNTAEAISFDAAVERLGGLTMRQSLPELPWFCANLESLSLARQEGRPLAVVGGPCLFGVDEVLVEVSMGSERKVFDYCTGRHFNAEQDGEEENLSQFLLNASQRITGINIHDQKTGVTSQEHSSILWLFQVADALNARIVMPLPDMSYEKYLHAILSPLPTSVTDAAEMEFRSVANRIAGLYIAETERIALDYPNVQYYILHERDEVMCRQFYRMREPFIERHKVLRRITGIPEKLESIKDYISMLALPYYLYGIQDILQVDSLDEIDSFRKCRWAHKGTVNLACMLYPERLSKDGINTIFQATHAFKEYRNEDAI